uniref:helix-turn-helix domain-containing protein n=1 Tax=Trichocoleus desertorum TaxID=1481672 RepID=UPI0028F42040|nr:helix-turn-helix transcriptional regulator [Trichocoleus desertorum]
MIAVDEMPKRKASRGLTTAIRCHLQKMMDDRGLSQVALAKETGLAISTIGGLCRNQFTRIDCDTALVLCEHFSCGLCDLFEIVSSDGGD